MTKGLRSITVALTVVLPMMATASAGGLETGTAPRSSAGGSAERPFAAVLTIETRPLADTGCTLTLAEEGAGRATRLRAFTWRSTETLDFCSKPDGINATITGSFVMTAVNGDELHGNYATLQRLDQETGQFTFGGLWWIEGGTGRFADARGHGILSGEGRLSAPPVSVTAAMVGRLGF